MKIELNFQPSIGKPGCPQHFKIFLCSQQRDTSLSATTDINNGTLLSCWVGFQKLDAWIQCSPAPPSPDLSSFVCRTVSTVSEQCSSVNNKSINIGHHHNPFTPIHRANLCKESQVSSSLPSLVLCFYFVCYIIVNRLKNLQMAL